MNQPSLIVIINRLCSQTIYIHGFSRNEMLYSPLDFRRTRTAIRTIMGGFSLITHTICATFGTGLDELYLLHVRCTLIFIHTYHFGNDFTAFLHIYHISDVQVEVVHHISVMERSPFYHGSSQLDRIHICHRRNSTCPPHLISHFIKSGAGSFCLKLIGYGPSRALSRIAQMTLLAKGIHLQHNSVCSHRKILAFLVPIVDKIEDFINRPAFPHALGNLKAPTGSLLQILILIAVCLKFITQQIIEISIQSTLSHHFGILRFQSSTGCISGISEKRLFPSGTFFI